MLTEQKSKEQGLPHEQRVTPELDIGGKKPPIEVAETELGVEIGKIETPVNLEPPIKEVYVDDRDGFVITFYLKQDEAADNLNYAVPLYTAFFPCELMAMTWYYVNKSTNAGAGFDVTRTRASTPTSITKTLVDLTDDAETFYERSGDEFDIRGRFLDRGDSLVLQSAAAPTGCKNLSVTFHFKYSGRGSSRLV